MKFSWLYFAILAIALMASAAVCGNCHSDEVRMRKYGLSVDILENYLADFHGVTVSMKINESAANRATSGPAEGPPGNPAGVTNEIRMTAVCKDCHGAHDMRPARGADSLEMRKRLKTVCRHCHATAGDNFPDAWARHYEPTLEKMPITYLIRLFYWLFIPFVTLGLVLQIILHYFWMFRNPRSKGGG